MENGNKITFLDIVSRHKIEIPVIQRDYAQGRISNRVTPIRTKFVHELVKTIMNGNKEQMHLDFVYGRIDGKNQKLIFAKNKEAIENILLAVKGYADQCNIQFDPKIKVPDSVKDDSNSIFIPLDGQQRLTTLYLLHWYLLKSIKVYNKDIVLIQLSGFGYKTRNSTKEFCEFLIANVSTLILQSGKKISCTIEESPNFFTIWKRDPSVQGMLTTLDELHKLLNDADEDSLVFYWHNLTTNRKITFDFLDLDEYEQTDELYVKMNARGKQLSDFEHYKSWLHDFIKSTGLQVFEKGWSDLIDTVWLDLFWKNKQENTFEVDINIYNFIKSVNLFEYVNLSDKETINKELINKIRETNEDKNFISIAEYEKSVFFSKVSLDFTFSCLTKLQKIDLEACHKVLENVTLFPFMGSQTKVAKLPLTFLSDNLNPSLPDRVFYYAFLLFVTDESIDLSDDTSKVQLEKWMRICRNLVYNTYIQNPENFIDAIKAMNEFSKSKYRVEEAILEVGFNLKFFDTQLKEEIKKIHYFNKGENWKSKIIQTENHDYFYGQIGFIFKINNSTDDYSKFEFYANKLAKIFDNPEADSFLFQRLLLSKGDYLIQSGSKWSFCESIAGSLRARQDNWRKVFNDDKKLEYLKAVLDESNSINVAGNSISTYSELGWESFFIKEKYTENLRYLQNLIINWESNWNIRLLEWSTLKGKHADLFSYSLYLDLKTEIPILDIKYLSVNGKRLENNRPMIEIKFNSEVMNVVYEPNYTNQDCAFLIEFGHTQTLDKITYDMMNSFEKSENKLIYKIEQVKIAEKYSDAFNAIATLFKMK